MDGEMQYYDVKIFYYSEESDTWLSGHFIEKMRVKAFSQEDAIKKAKEKFDSKFKERNKDSTWATFYNIKNIEVYPVFTCKWCRQPKEKCVC